MNEKNLLGVQLWTLSPHYRCGDDAVNLVTQMMTKEEEVEQQEL